MNTKMKIRLLMSAFSSMTIVYVLLPQYYYHQLYQTFPNLDRKRLRKAWKNHVAKAYRQEYTDDELATHALIDSLIIEEYRKLSA